MKLFNYSLLGLFIVLNSNTAAASHTSETVTQQIDAVVSKYEQQGPFHGNIEIRIGNTVVYKKSTGLAIDAFQIPHSETSRFAIASVSKSFTAAALLKLVEQKKIELDKSYCQYVEIFSRALQENIDRWCSFTVRELLNHSAGIIRDPKPVAFYSPSQYQPYISLTLLNMIRNTNLFLKDKQPVSRYSNLGYMMLAHLIEEVTDEQDFHSFLKNEIFDPLDLSSTGQFHRMFAIPLLAEGYEFPDGKDGLHRRCCSDASSYIGSHSLYSDINDLMLWLDALFAPHNSFLDATQIDEMTNKQVLVSGRDDLHYGFGFFIDEIEGQARYWHDGFEPGYLSLISYLPGLQAKIVILANRHTSVVYSGNIYVQKMSDEISQLLIKQN